jgi:hypothetical protein
MNKFITTTAYSILCIVTVTWMVIMIWLGFNILDQLIYLAESSDYHIQLLDNIWGELEPLSELGLLGHNRSFSCEIG